MIVEYCNSKQDPCRLLIQSWQNVFLCFFLAVQYSTYSTAISYEYKCPDDNNRYTARTVEDHPVDTITIIIRIIPSSSFSIRKSKNTNLFILHGRNTTLYSNQCNRPDRVVTIIGWISQSKTMCGSYDKDPLLWFATATATAIVVVVVVSTIQIQQEETLPHVPSHHITSHHITPPPCFMPTPFHLVGVCCCVDYP